MSHVKEYDILDRDFDYNLEYEDPYDYTSDTTEQILKEEYGGTSETLSEYLYKWICNININLKTISKKTDYIDSKNDDLFLNFNYTDTLETTYKIDASQICHIHGSSKNLPLILGHNNEVRIAQLNQELETLYPTSEEIEPNSIITKRLEYETLINYYDETCKYTDDCISDNHFFFSDLEDIENIFIIGHSLGNVDMPYFKKIKNNVNDNVIWNIYAYSEEEIKSFKKKLLDLNISNSNLKVQKTEVFFNVSTKK